MLPRVLPSMGLRKWLNIEAHNSCHYVYS